MINRMTVVAVAFCALVAVSMAKAAPTVTIDAYTFDLAQFTGAAVTYRPDGSVGFAGKAWDQAAGVDGYTLGELASGQAGGDPGDQISLNDTETPDWLTLTYGTPVDITATLHHLVIYEISSYEYVDDEGLAFRINVNSTGYVPASAAAASNFWVGEGSDAQRKISTNWCSTCSTSVSPSAIRFRRSTLRISTRGPASATRISSLPASRAYRCRAQPWQASR